MLEQKEFAGINTVEEFKDKAYSIIRKPDKVYVEVARDGNYYFAFFKEDVLVITSDDNMSINSMYKTEDTQWLKKERKAVIRIY